MYKKVSVTITTTLIIAAILTVSWSALQRSYAQSDFANTILKIHNDERAAVGKGVLDLKWSDSLAADAKKWADYLASLPPKPSSDRGWNQCCGGEPDLVHSGGTGQGENLWAGGANYYSTADMVKDWAAEKSNYHGAPLSEADFAAGAPMIGHYTQMVWKNTREVGCATATGNQGKFEFLVCRYSPPGNTLRQTPY